MLFAEGGIYEGGLAEGKANGKGIYIDLKGDIYMGNWNKGVADGEFVVNRTDGSTDHQTWRNNQQVSDNGGSK